MYFLENQTMSLEQWQERCWMRQTGKYIATALYFLRDAAGRRSDWEVYSDRFVLLKGCSRAEISAAVYMHATKKLLPHVRKLMYGEACSNVPVFNQKRSRTSAAS